MVNMTTMMTSLRQRYSQSNPQALRNPWVLGWIALVVVFIGVNALFFVLAVASSPGLVVDNYYEQGRKYEQNALSVLAARAALQWETRLEVPRDVRVDENVVVRFSAVDLRGVPIQNAEVRMIAYRPSDANADLLAQLAPVAPGQYQTDVSLPLPGVWDLNVTVQRGEDHFETTQRIAVQRP